MSGEENQTMYPGGKNTCYQKIINLIPRHQVYIEPFFGSGAVMRHKRPSQFNIGIDLDPAASSYLPERIATTDDARGHRQSQRGRATPSASASAAAATQNGRGAPSPQSAIVASIATADDVRYIFINDNALHFLTNYDFTGDEFIYCDPPYLMTARKSARPRYTFEFSTAVQHQQLLSLLLSLPCKIMISGYASELYSRMLSDWETYTFTSQTHNGTAVEWLWMNYERPLELHDYRYLGSNFRERERIKRKAKRWVKRFQSLPLLERQAIVEQLHEAGVL